MHCVVICYEIVDLSYSNFVLVHVGHIQLSLSWYFSKTLVTAKIKIQHGATIAVQITTRAFTRNTSL